VGTILNYISMVLTRHNIKTVDLLPRKVASFLGPVRDDNGLKTAGAYSISCEYGNVYID
jgi:hypothetical protein